MCHASQDIKFTCIGSPKRIWAVSAIHGEAERLMALHDELFKRINPGDRVIYHGNYIGYGPNPCETVDELLTFRRQLLAIPGMMPQDLVYLRGGQEEMWQKLTQIQFAPNPSDVLLWMLSHGLSNTLYAYGLSPHDGITAAQEGVMSLTRWTNKVRESVKQHAGHEIFSNHWRRAAYTAQESAFPMLFVHAGLDPAKTLDHQGDNLWWSGKNFNDIRLPYNPFQKVIRGFDPKHHGMHLNCVTATIDGGCGFGGSLVCAGFDENGEIFEMLEA